ncbi:hypothetical protein ABMA28_009334 [Loxostege sticticalis]|uniref:Gustatory receptor n=1 Tax=Loxostege sticticalis TaxID=481309 RepID=A0ABD0SF18_LOXSC
MLLQLVLTLVSNTIDITVTMFLPFADEINQQGPLDTLITYLIVAEELLLLFAPAFTAGLVTSQAQKLKLALYDKLIKDKTQTKDIKRFVGYINSRPLRFKVWRVVPLDWRLPVIVTNISVTYLIVMIQFTHNH